ADLRSPAPICALRTVHARNAGAAWRQSQNLRGGNNARQSRAARRSCGRAVMVIAARLRNAAAHLGEIDGYERAYHDYDARSYALHRKLLAVEIELRAVAEQAAAIEAHGIVPRSARAGLSVVQPDSAA